MGIIIRKVVTPQMAIDGLRKIFSDLQDPDTGFHDNWDWMSAGFFVEVLSVTNTNASDRIKTLTKALETIAERTNPDAPDENYRADDREGCLDTVYSIASSALAKL
jgi:hypothetical protein